MWRDEHTRPDRSELKAHAVWAGSFPLNRRRGRDGPFGVACEMTIHQPRELRGADALPPHNSLSPHQLDFLVSRVERRIPDWYRPTGRPHASINHVAGKLATPFKRSTRSAKADRTAVGFSIQGKWPAYSMR